MRRSTEDGGEGLTIVNEHTVSLTTAEGLCQESAAQASWSLRGHLREESQSDLEEG